MPSSYLRTALTFVSVPLRQHVNLLIIVVLVLLPLLLLIPINSLLVDSAESCEVNETNDLNKLILTAVPSETSPCHAVSDNVTIVRYRAFLKSYTTMNWPQTGELLTSRHIGQKECAVFVDRTVLFNPSIVVSEGATKFEWTVPVSAICDKNSQRLQKKLWSSVTIRGIEISPTGISVFNRTCSDSCAAQMQLAKLALTGIAMCGSTQHTDLR